MNYVIRAMACVLLLCGVLCFAQEAKRKPAEQTSFCEDGAPGELRLRPTALPRAVVAGVMNTQQGRDAKREAKNAGREIDPDKILRGTTIRLSDAGGSFYLVLGSPPMAGADNTWFWIVRQEGGKVRILLFAGGDCLDLAEKRTLSYRDLATTWSSPQETITETYAYNGAKYKLLRRRSRPNKDQ